MKKAAVCFHGLALAFVVMPALGGTSVRAFAQVPNPPANHAGDGRAPATDNPTRAASGLIVIPEDATPELVRRYLEDNAATVDAKCAAPGDQRAKELLVDEYAKTVRHFFEKKKLDAATLSYRVMVLADSYTGKQEFLQKKILSEIAKPAGRRGDALNLILEGKRPNEAARASLARWARNQALEKYAANQPGAEAYLRLALLVKDSRTAANPSQWMTDHAKNLAGYRASFPLELKEVPDTHDQNAIVASIAEMLPRYHEALKLIEDRGLSADELWRRFGGIFNLREETPDKPRLKDAAEARAYILQALGREFNEQLDFAIASLGADAGKLPIDALLLADKFNFFVAADGMPGSTTYHFAKRLRDLINRQGIEVPPVVYRFLPTDDSNYADFEAVDAASHAAIKAWAEENAKKHKDSNPALAEALAILAVRADLDQGVRSHIRKNTYRVHREEFTAHNALARVTGDAGAPVAGRPKLFRLLPTLVESGRYDNEARMRQIADENFMAALPVVIANKDQFQRILAEMEGWDPTKKDPAVIRREMLAAYGAFLPPSSKGPDFDIARAKALLMEEFKGEFLAFYSTANFATAHTHRPRPFPLDFYLLGDRLQNKTRDFAFLPAARDQFEKEGIAKRPAEAVVEAHRLKRLTKQQSDALSPAEQLWLQLEAYHQGAADDRAVAGLVDRLAPFHFHPAITKPDFAAALGALDAWLGHKGPHDAGLLAGPNRPFSPAGLHDGNPLVSGALSLDAAKLKATDELVKACPTDDYARSVLYHDRFRSARSPHPDDTPEHRASNLTFHKDVLYHKLIALEAEADRIHVEVSRRNLPPAELATYLKDQTDNIFYKREEAIRDFKGLFLNYSRKGSPREVLSYPPDVLLLVDRIDRTQPANQGRNYFIAKCIATLKASRLPAGLMSLLNDGALQKIYESGLYPGQQYAANLAITMRAAVQFCRANPRDCAHDTVDTMVLLMNVVMHDWAPLKDKLVATPGRPIAEWGHTYSGAFMKQGGNRPYLVSCAHEQMKGLLDLDRANTQPSDTKEVSWLKPETFNPADGAPFLPYPEPLTNDVYTSNSERNLKLAEEALEILRRPNLTYEDYVKYFGPYHQKKLGEVPAPGVWPTMRAATLAQTRNAVLSEVFGRYLSKLNNTSATKVKSRILRHAASGAGTPRVKDGNIDHILAEMDVRPGDTPATVAARREGVRKWMIEAMGNEGIEQPKLTRVLAMALDAMDRDGATLRGKPMAETPKWAEEALDHAIAEARLREGTPATAALVDRISTAAAAKGMHVPGEVRRWIFAKPDGLARMADTMLKYEPLMFFAMLVENEDHSEDWARRARPFLPSFIGRMLDDGKRDRSDVVRESGNIWGKFTQLPPIDDATIAINARRAQAALEFISKHPLTEGELEELFGDYYASRTGLRLLEELSLRTFDRRHLDEFQQGRWKNRVATAADTAGLRAVLMDEALGLAQFVSSPSRFLAPGMSPDGGSSGGAPQPFGAQVDAARQMHGTIWAEDATRRGKLFTLGREFWRPQETRVDPLRKFALFVTSSEARGMQRQIPPTESFEVADNHANQIGNVLGALRATRGKPADAAALDGTLRQVVFEKGPTDALNPDQTKALERYKKLFAVARGLEHRSPNEAEMKALVDTHLGAAATDEDRKIVTKMREVLRVARTMGDFTKKEGNAYAADPAWDLYKKWSEVWHEKITSDGHRLNLTGYTRQEATAHQELIPVRDEIERMLGRSPSLTRPSTEPPIAETETEPKFNILAKAGDGHSDIDLNFVNWVLAATTPAERARRLRTTINVTVYHTDRRKNNFRPGLAPHEHAKQPWGEHGIPLRPGDPDYVHGLESARMQVLCKIAEKRTGNSFPVREEPVGAGRRLDTSTMNVEMQALIRLVGAIDTLLVKGMGDSGAMDPRQYEALTMREIDQLRLGPQNRYCSAQPYQHIPRRAERETAGFEDRQIADDDVFVRSIGGFLDHEDFAHVWPGGTPDELKPQEVNIPDFLVPHRKPMTADFDPRSDIPRALATFGYGKLLNLVPEEIPPQVRRALDAMSPERRAYWEKQWWYTDPITRKPAGVQVESRDLLAKARMHEGEARMLVDGHMKSAADVAGAIGDFFSAANPLSFEEWLSRKMKYLEEAGTERQKASDMRQAWYQGIMEEHWNAHMAATAGLDLAARQRMRTLPPFHRKLLLRVLEKKQREARALILQARELDRRRQTPTEADRLRKRARDLQLEVQRLAASPWPGGVLHANWSDPQLKEFFLNEAKDVARRSGNRDAIDAAFLMHHADTHYPATLEKIRDHIYAALQKVRMDPATRDILREDQDLAHTLTSFLNILEDRGHMARAMADRDYQKNYENIRSGGGRIDRFDPKMVAQHLHEERKAFNELCGPNPNHPNCVLYHKQVAAMRTQGYGLHTDARRLLLDPVNLPPDSIGAFERAESILSGHAGDASRPAHGELLFLRISPSQDKVNQILRRWDPNFHSFVASERRQKDLSDQIVSDLIRASRSGKVLAVPIGQDGKPGAAGPWQCKDLNVRVGADGKSWTSIANIDATSLMVLDSKMRIVARLVAERRARERLATDPRNQPAPEALQELAERLLPDIMSEVDQDLRKLAAERYLAMFKKPDGSGLAEMKLDDPRSEHGCALRAILAPVNHAAATKETNSTYTEEIDKFVDNAFGPNPDRTNEHVREVLTWGADRNAEEFKRRRTAYIDKLSNEYFGNHGYFADVEDDFTKHAGQHGATPIPGRLAEADHGAKGKARNHLFACLEDEKIRLAPLEAEVGEQVESIAKSMHDEIAGVQVLNSIVQREVTEFAQKTDPRFGEIAASIRFLSNVSPTEPGHIQNLEKSLEEMKKHPKAADKDRRKSQEELEKQIADYKMKHQNARHQLFRERMRMEALTSSPMDGGRRPIEEEDADDAIKRIISKKIGDEIARAHKAAVDAANATGKPRPIVGAFPSPEFIAALEGDQDILKPTNDFVARKMGSAWVKPNMPEMYPEHGDDNELTALKAKGLIRQQIMELRAHRVDELKKAIVDLGQQQQSSALSRIRSNYMDHARRCMTWMEGRNLGIRFARATGTEEFADAEVQSVANLLLNHQMQRQSVEALAKVMQPPTGVANPDNGNFASVQNASVNQAIARGLDALKKQITEGVDSVRVPAAKVDEWVQHGFAQARQKQIADTAALQGTMQKLAPMGFKWNGLALTWDDNLDLSKLGQPGMPKDIAELRQVLESFSKYGRYGQTASDPWMELVSAMYSAYQGAQFRNVFELGKTAIRLTSTGEGIAKKDFLTDMPNAEKYLKFENLEDVRGRAQARARQFRMNAEAYSRARKNLIASANRLFPDISFKLANMEISNWPTQPGFNPFGVEAGQDLTDKWNELARIHATMATDIHALEHEFAAVSFDWEGAGTLGKVRAHSLAATMKNQKRYLTDTDFFNNVPLEITKAIDAQEKFWTETLYMEAALLGADLLTGGATAGLHAYTQGAVWSARATRIAKTAASLHLQIKHGVRLGNYSAFLSKAAGDLVGNLRYGVWDGNGDPEVAMPWEGTQRGAAQSRLIFGALPVVTAGLTAGWNLLRLPTQLAPYIVGPIGMAGTNTAVEIMHGQDTNIALHNAQHSLLIGLPFGDMLARGGSRLRLVANSPAAQRHIARLATYGIFQGHSFYQSRLERFKEGKYVNPFTGEEAKPEEIDEMMLYDSMTNGAVLDLYFAGKSAKEMNAATARSLLRRGVPVATVQKIYETPHIGNLFNAKGGKELIEEALGGFDVNEIRLLSDRQRELKRQLEQRPEDAQSRERLASTQSLLDALAHRAGFKNENGRDRDDFIKYLELATNGGDRSKTIREMHDRIKRVARHDLARTLKAKGGHGLVEMFNHSLFRNEEGQFDPAGHEFIPIDLLQRALRGGDPSVIADLGRVTSSVAGRRLQGRDWLERNLLRVYYYLAGDPPRAPYFAHFVKYYKQKTTDTLAKLVKRFKRAGADDIIKMMKDGDLTIEGMILSFPPDVVIAVLKKMAVKDVADRMKEAKDPNHPNYAQANMLIQAYAKALNMDPGLFMNVLERYLKGRDGHGFVGNLVAAAGLPVEDIRLTRPIGEVFDQLKGPQLVALIREHAATPDGMQNFVQDEFFQQPENFHYLPPDKLNLDFSKPGAAHHAIWLMHVAMHHQESNAQLKKFLEDNRIDPKAYRLYVLEWMQQNHGRYQQIDRAMADASAHFLAQGRARIAEQRRAAEAKNPMPEFSRKTAAELKGSLDEILVNPHLRELLGENTPIPNPTSDTVNQILMRLEALDRQNNTHIAYDTAIDLVKKFPDKMTPDRFGTPQAADPSAGIARAVAQAALRSPHPELAGKVLEALYHAPNGARLVSLLDAKTFADLIAKAGARNEVSPSQLTTLFRDVLGKSEFGDTKLPEAQRLEALLRVRALALEAVEHLKSSRDPQGSGSADTINTWWRDAVQKMRGTVSAGSPIEGELQASLRPDLVQRIGVKLIEPRLANHANVRPFLKTDGKLNLSVEVKWRDGAAPAQLEAAIHRAAEGVVDGDLVPFALVDGRVVIGLENLRDSATPPAPGGRQRFVRTVLDLVDAYQAAPSAAPTAPLTTADLR